MDRIDFQEKKWGFIFGVIAIIAAIVEMIVSGISAASVVGAIKDIFGTLVVVVVFYYVIKTIPRKPKNTVELLKKTIEDWGLDNAPLIFKTEGYVAAKDSSYTQGFVLLQNPKSYPELADLTPDSANWIDYAQYKSPQKLTGKFLDMPSYESMTIERFEVLFVMEQKHFQEMNIDMIIESIRKAILQKYDGKIRVNRPGKAARLTLEYDKIVTVSDIEYFRDSLDFVLSLVKVVA